MRKQEAKKMNQIFSIPEDVSQELKIKKEELRKAYYYLAAHHDEEQQEAIRDWENTLDDGIQIVFGLS